MKLANMITKFKSLMQLNLEELDSELKISDAIAFK
jgi:hypothetical protein